MTGLISKLIGVKVKKSLGTINDSVFPPDDLNYVSYPNAFQRRAILRTNFHRGALRGGFSRGVETGWAEWETG